jgi:hypothetical protein
MSVIRAIKHRLGLSVTPANNFVLDASADNGTMKLARESGQDIMTVDAAGKVSFPQQPIINSGPAFRARQSTTQAATGVAIKVVLGFEEFDTGNCFADSRFTPNVAGYYRVSGIVRCAASNNMVAAFAYIYKNGSQVSQSGNNVSFNGSSHPTVTDLVYMNGSTDYVELYGLASATSGAIFEFANAGSCASFSAELVRAA